MYVGHHSSRGHLSFLNIIYVKHFTNKLYLFNFDWFSLSFAEVDLLTLVTPDVFL